MGQPAEQLRNATYADIEALPPNMIGQLLHGDLFAMSRPTTRHANAATSLAIELGGPFQRRRGGPGGWRFLNEPELHFPNPAVKAGKDVLVPDLGAWRTERMPDVLEGVDITIVPDWICEVLSPSTEEIDRTVKMPIYAREGVLWAWLIDPVKRTLELYMLRRSGWEAAGEWRDEDLVRAKPFEAVEFELGVLWR